MKSTLYLHYSADPYFNMGFDEWMLKNAANSPGAILWRLYTWQSGTITFGYNQRQETALDFEKVSDTPVIRRVTGGRALYHDISELTYSVAFNSNNPGVEHFKLGPAKSSETIAQILAKFLSARGITATWEQSSAKENSRRDFFHKAACFASHARHELVSGGGKIVASARREWNGGVLQHGSIKLDGFVAHPALHFQPNARAGAEKSLERSELNIHAEAFVNAIRDTIKIEVGTTTNTLSDSVGLAQRIELVRQYPYEKRDLIEHSDTVASQ